MATSITTQARRAGFGIQAIIGIVALIGLVAILAGLNSLANMDASLALTQERGLPLALKVREIRLDVVEIRQLLSSISASRGQDGLDDGFRQAAENAKRFAVDLTEGRKLAEGFADPRLLAGLDGLKPSFDAYYALGQVTARAYVDGGPSAGNAMMPEFHRHAEAVAAQLEQLVAATDILTAAQAEASRRVYGGERVKSMIVAATLVAIAGAAFALVYLGGRRIKSVAELLHRANIQVVEAARGNLNARITRIGRDDELGILLQSVNRVLDLSEVFAKETGAVMQHLTRKEYYRVIPEGGMRGEFLKNSRMINGMVADMDSRAKEAAIVNEVSEIVGAAARGELSRRIDLKGKDGFMLELCTGLNALTQMTDLAMRDVAGAMARIADGDLSHRITADYRGVFGQIKDHVNTTSDRLAAMVAEISADAAEIGHAAAEVATGSRSLSERSEQQASSLEETSATMEEMAAAVHANATNAQQASKLASDAWEIAISGGDVVSKAIGAMGRIRTSSQQIGDIVGMIDEIAFQTNLLALNAAVEAARAGESGKGFAVVAQEVRHLAQRSAQASRDIKSLIQGSSTEVTAGAELVQATGGALDKIVASVRRVADIIGDIATSSGEQATGIDQVSAAINQMDELTQQNAAMVEESAAAAATMEDRSRRLADLMGRFRMA